MKQTVHTKNYTRKDGTPVKGYSQQRDTWKETARAGSLSAASGLTALFLAIEVGFTLISTAAILILACLSGLAGRQTIHTIAPNRTRPAPGSEPSRRKVASKARWRARRRKAGKWIRGKGGQWAMAGARAAGRGGRRLRNRFSDDPVERELKARRRAAQERVNEAASLEASERASADWHIADRALRERRRNRH